MAAGDEFLTPQEIAEKLKISTYTAYELIKRGELNAVRVGRQLRIPRGEMKRYTHAAPLGRSSSQSTPELAARPLLIAGSHDPGLEILISETRKRNTFFQANTSYIGSLEGLVALFQHRARIAGAHLWEQDAASRREYLRRVVPNHRLTAVRLALRSMGLGVPKGNPREIKGLHDLKDGGLRFANRQRGSGTRVRFEQLAREASINPEQIEGFDEELDTHHSVAMAIGSGEADVGLLCETTAKASGLDFIPLYWEPYDLVMETSSEELPGVAALFATLESERFQERLARLGGYELSQTAERYRIQT